MGGYTELLNHKNGFYAFESSLHVFPDRTFGSEVGFAEWNSQDSWRDEYGPLAANLAFFAEDLFGNQFAISDDGIVIFDPETGKCDHLASDIAEWAHQILIDYEYLTGCRLAHEWQIQHGSIPSGNRLVPKIPFVLGGEYELANLRIADSKLSMFERADIAKQVAGLPDGAHVTLKVE
ncbi:hypothetical protein [Pyruvatibacter sp.]